MQFTTSALAAILAYTTSTLATPLSPRQTDLQDWQLTELTTGTPSGRPGSYPWATLTAQITDPNEIDLGPAKTDGSPVTAPAGSKGLNCVAKYFVKNSGNPLDHIWPCDPVPSGYWTMQVLPGSEGTFRSTNFNLKFTHVADVLYQGGQYTASFEGEVHINEQLQGTCGGSGVCSWGLKPGESPVLVPATKI